MGEEYTGILTEKFVAVVGIDPRLYGTNSSVTSNPVRVVAGKWQEAAKEIFNECFNPKRIHERIHYVNYVSF